MKIHDDLKAWPEQHVSAVNIAFDSRNLTALELESKVLVQADAEKNAQAVNSLRDKDLR